MTIKIRGQHYVWRYYLDAWANDGKLYCLRDNRIFTVSPQKVAKERDFYRLRNLTKEDITFIELLAINPAVKHLQDLHRKLLQTFHTIVQLSEHANASLPDNHELRRELDVAVNNAEELLHGRIESSAQKYIDMLRNGDPSFFPDDKGLPNFFYFLCAQHFRTKGLKEKLLEKSRPLGTTERLEKGWNILSHIFAANLGWSLYVERREHQLILLENNTDTPFLTSDQPTINIKATGDDTPPERLAFYYPVSPSRAILLLDEASDEKTKIQKISIAEVEKYNRLMVNGSYDMVYSSDLAQLELLQESEGAKAAAILG